MEYFAHVRISEDGSQSVQTAAEHCRNTAVYAAEVLEEVKLDQAAYLAGLVHDLGKFKQEFQNYLMEGKGVRGSVNHTFAGCRMLLEHFHHEQFEDEQDVTCELLAYAVGAHHGLFDCIDEKGKSGFLHRMEQKHIGYAESKDSFLASCANWTELEERFQKAHEQLSAVYEKMEQMTESGGEISFYLGMLSRLLLSAVIEGDRRDTAEFMNQVFPKTRGDDQHLFWQKHLDSVEKKLEQFPKETDIQRARSEISRRCRDFAEKPEGIYRLNVPTGGGKTLSSLRYALAHAAKWGKKRVIFVTPLLAILEQNAKVLREYIGDDTVILEHHSNVIQTDTAADALDLRELAVDSWNAPVIITTLVQLLNTLFLGKTTSIRRFQALCDAVIVLDEVQTVPNHMLSLFNLAANFLASVCRTTFLLCSATQPCYEEAGHALLLSQPKDVIPYQETLWKTFHRTVLKDAGAMRLEQVPEFSKSILQETDSLLIICNKKTEAEFLFHALDDGSDSCFHLSASMCMAHRRDVLGKIEDSLKRGKKTVCVSTQVMEAGVDISFGRVIRLAAGMDSVVQAAGRCNRNGEAKEPSAVYIVQCTDENLGRLMEIQRAKAVTLALLNQFNRHPEKFQNDLSSNEAISWYYKKLFQEEKLIEGFQDYAVPAYTATLFSMLSDNLDYLDEDSPAAEKYTLNQAFKLAGSQFHVFDENTEDVVVPYGKGAALLAELAAYPQPVSPGLLHDWNTRAKPYTISLYEYQKNKLAGGLRSVGGVLALEPDYYDDHTGLLMKNENGFWEV